MHRVWHCQASHGLREHHFSPEEIDQAILGAEWANMLLTHPADAQPGPAQQESVVYWSKDQ
eukprot:10890890-Heterocapsa_arctica.AAC.1